MSHESSENSIFPHVKIPSRIDLRSRVRALSLILLNSNLSNLSVLSELGGKDGLLAEFNARLCWNIISTIIMSIEFRIKDVMTRGQE